MIYAKKNTVPFWVYRTIYEVYKIYKYDNFESTYFSHILRKCRKHVVMVLTINIVFYTYRHSNFRKLFLAAMNENAQASKPLDEGRKIGRKISFKVKKLIECIKSCEK